MSKRLLTLLMTFGVVLCLALIPVRAETLPRVVDGADLLTDSQEQQLTQKIAQIAEEYAFDAVIVTQQSFDGKSATVYADDYFDYNGYGYGSSYDGILLAICMNEREWAISTSGYGLHAFTDYSTDLMGENIVPYLSDGNYYQAFDVFLDMTADTLYQAKTGAPYDIDNLNPNYDAAAGVSLLWLLLPALLIAFVIALLIALGFKHQLKTARPQRAARNYVQNGSFRLNNSRDIYLYSNTTRTKIERSASSGGGTTSHTGSSGRSHGGSSGKF